LPVATTTSLNSSFCAIIQVKNWLNIGFLENGGNKLRGFSSHFWGKMHLK
jgi:hypothetical protein